MFITKTNVINCTKIKQQLVNIANKMEQIVSSSNRQEYSSSKTVGTHSGTFHCDEVLACFMLLQLPEYQNARILRSRNIEHLKGNCDVIVDVGGEFDPDRKLYDHHQRQFKETFSTLKPDLSTQFNIRLSSAGLIYCYYGEQVINHILRKYDNTILSPENLRTCYIQIYKQFIKEIDAIDNGVPLVKDGSEPAYNITTDLSSRVKKINPSWEEETNHEIEMERFNKAMLVVGQEFTDKVLDICGSWIKARQEVRKAIQNSESIYKTKEVLVLDKFCPWKAHLSDLEKEYGIEGIPKMVVFQEKENSWRICGVPVTPESFLGRKYFPVEWRGLRDEELSTVTGIPDLIFVHHTGFIAGAITFNSALSLAIKSVEWNE